MVALMRSVRSRPQFTQTGVQSHPSLTASSPDHFPRETLIQSRMQTHTYCTFMHTFTATVPASQQFTLTNALVRRRSICHHTIQRQNVSAFSIAS